MPPLIPLVLAAVLAPSASASQPVHTYSIVARDPVQSHWFAVGGNVAWAEAGVGAVATQSFIDPAYGPLGLALMRAGRPAPEALASLLAGDAQRDVRQVGMVDAQGRAASHTGPLCIPAAGGRSGAGYAVQANLMDQPTVWPAMARAYETAEGDLAERLLAALDAAQAEGGDIRGRQSAALLIVKGRSSGRPWADKLFDLRVDDHPEPLRELRRLARLQRAYNHMTAGDDCVALSDWNCAEREYGAARALEPAHAEMAFWAAVALATNGRLEAARPLFAQAFRDGERWRELVRRLPGVNQFPSELVAPVLSIR